MSTPKRRTSSTTRSTARPRRQEGATVTDLHRLPEGPDGWRLDDHTTEVARAGLAQARDALRRARLAVAAREAERAHSRRSHRSAA